MKNFSFILVLLLANPAITAYSQEEKDQFLKKINKEYLVQVNDTLWAGKYEVDNELYGEFLSFLRSSNDEKFRIAIYDTAAWLEIGKQHAPMMAFYHSHPAYKAYPVVNISYEGAVLFCEWLTAQYNMYPQKRFKKVVFRLPAEEEWTSAALGGLADAAYPWGNTPLVSQDGKYRCNYCRIGDERIHYNSEKQELEIVSLNEPLIEDVSTITAPVQSYWPNQLGMYNVCGNAAEMIREKGKSKGGSWRSPGYDVRLDVTGTYDCPSPDLGFRIFMVVTEL